MNRDIWERQEKKIQEEHLLKTLPRKEDLGEFVVMVAELKTVTGQVFPFESRLL